MTPLPIRTFRANLREWLARVARGESLTITYRGLAIAEVVPVGTMASKHPSDTDPDTVIEKQP